MSPESKKFLGFKCHALWYPMVISTYNMYKARVPVVVQEQIRS